jgi:hypothetical protein
MRRFALVIMMLYISPAFASLVVPSQLEEMAGQIHTVLKVRVKEIKQTENRMKLKDGSEGPVIGFEKIITADVIAELVGHVEVRPITVKYYMPVLAKYDAEGNVELTYSIQILGTALEYSIEKDQEYIFCFGPTLPEMWDQGNVQLMRAERPEMESAVIAAVNQAKRVE